VVMKLLKSTEMWIGFGVGVTAAMAGTYGVFGTGIAQGLATYGQQIESLKRSVFGEA